MLFNSPTFPFFLILVFVAYWALSRTRLSFQNLFLLVASYVFYGWWDYRFLALIIISSTVDYLCGLQIYKSRRPAVRKTYLGLSLATNLGMLGFFKYFNFFIGSFSELISMFGMHPNAPVLNVLLPVGISFYTFQTLSYTIDIYRGTYKPTSDIVAFFSFVAFFPQLVAGPIERAAHLLPQFEEKRKFVYGDAAEGLRRILTGLIKKMVIADNLAEHVDIIFANPEAFDGITLFLGGVFFHFQVYCDFSGYSDIAIGTARLFGFKLNQNFHFPFLARSTNEFWRRNHISLTTWFRDYIYRPLGGNRRNHSRIVFNLLATFTISGLWHGAGWPFVIWGFIHGVFGAFLFLSGKNKKYRTDVIAEHSLLPAPRELLAMLITMFFIYTSIIWFRAPTLANGLAFMRGIFISPLDGAFYAGYFIPLLICTLTFLAEYLQRSREHALDVGHLPWPARWGIYYIASIGLLIFANFGGNEFIYFNF